MFNLLTTEIKVVWAVLTAIATFCGGVLSRWIVLRIERYQHSAPEQRILKAEVEEVRKHYKANKVALGKMLAQLGASSPAPSGEKQGKLRQFLSTVHFEKLKFPTDSIFFNDRALRLLVGKSAEIALRMRARLRNRNTEAQQVIDFLRKGPYDEGVVREYLDHMQEQATFIEDYASWATGKLNRKWYQRWRPYPTEPKNLNRERIFTEPEQPGLYPKIDAIDLEALADLVAARMRSKPPEKGDTQGANAAG